MLFYVLLRTMGDHLWRKKKHPQMWRVLIPYRGNELTKVRSIFYTTNKITNLAQFWDKL